MSDMLGQASASSQPFPRRWLFRIWGSPDIHSRQKWTILWPHLAQLSQQDVRLLDAGCGRGQWALELAARRPDWSVVGVDRCAESLEVAQAGRRRLGLSNVEFVQADFLSFQPAEPFDAVLSVASAHYLVQQGKGPALFHSIRTWLTPGGRLYLLGPRWTPEAPFVSWLPAPSTHDLFSFQDLTLLCQSNGLSVTTLRGCVGPPGALAKQLHCCAVGLFRIPLLALLYPLELALTTLDARAKYDQDRPTVMLLLIAQTVAGAS